MWLDDSRSAIHPRVTLYQFCCNNCLYTCAGWHSGMVSEPVIATVTIPSTRPWTDTGIVVAEGDRIEIVASGLVSWDSSHNKTGPDGTDNPAGTANNVVVDPTVPAQSLVGNVAETVTLDGRGFFVGSHFSGEIPIANTTSASGRLFLGFNDGAVFSDRSGYDAWGFGGDNQGSFTAALMTYSLNKPMTLLTEPRSGPKLTFPLMEHDPALALSSVPPRIFPIFIIKGIFP